MMCVRHVILALMTGIRKVFVPIHLYDYCFRSECFPNHVIYQPSAPRFVQEWSLPQGALTCYLAHSCRKIYKVFREPRSCGDFVSVLVTWRQT